MSDLGFVALVAVAVVVMVVLGRGLRPLCDCTDHFVHGPPALAGRSPSEDLRGLSGRQWWTISGQCPCGEAITGSFMGDLAMAHAWMGEWLDLATEAHLLRCPVAAVVRTEVSRARRNRRVGEEILGAGTFYDQDQPS